MGIKQRKVNPPWEINEEYTHHGRSTRSIPTMGDNLRDPTMGITLGTPTMRYTPERYPPWDTHLRDTHHGDNLRGIPTMGALTERYPPWEY